MDASAVDIVVTNCYRPCWTFRAVETLRKFYPDNRIIVVDDACVDCEWQLVYLHQRYGVHLVRMPKRRGAGRAIDAGMRAASSEWVLTHDHGVTVTRPGFIEYLLAHVEDNVVAVGKKLHNLRGQQYLGEAVYCDLAIWKRTPIVDNDLSFKLTTLHFPDGSSFWGCTTARYLCWQLRGMGHEFRFVDLNAYHTHEHTRTGHGKGFASPHEDVEFDWPRH